MRKFTFTLLLSMLTLGMFAQLVNDGATITIKPGATLFVETDVTNNATGTINIEGNGILEVQGNLTNSGNLNTSSTSKVKFTGALASNLNAGLDSIANLELAKTAAVNVTLTGGVVIKNNLDFNSASASSLMLGANNITFNSAATITGHDNNEYMVTASTGRAIKNALSTAFEFPVGNSVSTYNPVMITQTTTTDNIGVRVLANAFKDGTVATVPFTAGVVDASWDVTSSGGASILTVKPQWAPSDELAGFKRADCGVSKFVSGTNYDLVLSDLGASVAATNPATDWTRNRAATTSGLFVVGADDVMTFVSVAAKSFLGAYNSTTGLMGDQLRIGASGVTVLPLKEPYTTYDPDGNSIPNFIHVGRAATVRDSVLSQTDFDLTGTNNDVVDWVFLQVRNIAAPYTVVATRSAFIQRDGDIVGVDGNAVKFIGLAAGTYKVAVRHRNHLGVLTANDKALTTTPTVLNFTDATTPEPVLGGVAKMDLIAGTFPAYTLTPGDANANAAVQASDLNTYWLPTNGTIYTASQYITVGRADWNLNRAVQASDNNNHWLPNNGVLQGFNNN